MKGTRDADEESETMRAMHHHPTRDELCDLAQGGDFGSGDPGIELPREVDGNGTARGHLLRGCPQCATTLRRATLDEVPAMRRLIKRTLLAPDDPNAVELRELAARATAWSTVMEAERAAARELEEMLLALPPTDRAEAVRTGHRYRSVGLVDHLVERARVETIRDPAQSRCLAELAVEAAESLDPASYPEPFVQEARVLAWAALGNALRAVSDLFGAERAFVSARSHLQGAEVHPVVRAELLSLLGSLRIDQTRFEEAIQLLEEAAEIYRTFSESSLEGKTVVKLANAWGDAGHSERAVSILEKAETLLSPSEDQEVYLLARHAHAARLEEAGRPREAARLFEQFAPEYKRAVRGFSRQQRLDWLGARIAWALGDRGRAEAELELVRQRFAEREEVYDFALVSLDLAMLYLEEGRVDELRRLTAEMLPVFTSRRVHQHALAALVLLQRSAEADSATETFVRDLARFLHRARRNPYLKFEPSS